MDIWTNYAIPGLFVIAVIYLATIRIWLHARKTHEILGKGLLSHVIHMILLAGAFLVVHSAFNVLYLQYDYVIFNMISGIFLIITPFILLYSVWTIDIYANKLKDMAE